MVMRKRLFLFLLPAFLLLAGGVLLLSINNFAQIAGCPCNNPETTTGEFLQNEKEAYFAGQRIGAPLAALPTPVVEETKVLGQASEGEKWIEIDLSAQKLRAWEGNNLFLETLISSGKPWTPTITGEFRIWSKFQYAKMSGGEKGTKSYYYLPNVPYIMYFHKEFALHGVYWHANFGTTMSNGCVNLPTPIAEKLFYWTDPVVPSGQHFTLATSDNLGTRVVIHN